MASDNRSRTETLAAISIFSGMDSESLEAVGRAAMERTYDKDEVVFLEGSACSGLHVVEEGWVKAYKISEAGRELVVRFAGPGEAFNEIGAFAGEGNHASVKAMEPTVILVVPCESLMRLMGEYKSFSQLVTKNLANRVVYLMSLVEDFSLRSVISRLSRYLIENSVGGVVKRRSWSTQTELASRLGTVPDVLNRALRSLAGQNLIEIDRRVLKIIDHDGLLAKSQSAD